MLQIIQGDITKQTTDAIVNAANGHLAHGGGVARAICDAAGGDEFQQMCFTALGEEVIETGEAFVTEAGELPCKYVIHAVGPDYREHTSVGESSQQLTAAYTNSCIAALEYGLDSIAFPSISTGIYAFPLRPAAVFAIGALLDYEDQLDISLVLFSDEDLAAYEQAISFFRESE